MQEELNFKANYELALHELQHAFVEKIALSIETNPTFDFKVLPFRFEYSFFAILFTNKGNFKIIPAQASSGENTFWIQLIKNFEETTKTIHLNSFIKNIYSEIAKESRYIFKIVFEFETAELFLYCGEIYDTTNETLDYRVNDEMILVFHDKKEAQKFEDLVNCR